VSTVLTTQELAEHLKCSTKTIERLRVQGLPHFKVGDSPRFELAAVLAWLKERWGRNV
jgi:excisionase family DNA binding protein